MLVRASRAWCRDGLSASFFLRDVPSASFCTSFRSRLRDTPVDVKILRYIDENNLGNRTNRRRTETRQVGKWNTRVKATSESIDKLFSARFRLMTKARTEEEFPKPSVPEIAFAGRSNVGKSTLLKALSIRGADVTTSDKPGTTVTLDWFELKTRPTQAPPPIAPTRVKGKTPTPPPSSPQESSAAEAGDAGEAGDSKASAAPLSLRLVDLPGYGFAYATEQVQRQWHGLLERYFRRRGPSVLKRVFVLIDARHGFKQTDLEMLTLLDLCKVKHMVVMTKCDLVKPIELAQRTALVKKELQQFQYNVGGVVLVSGKDKTGINNIYKEIASLFNVKLTYKTSPTRPSAQPSKKKKKVMRSGHDMKSGF